MEGTVIHDIINVTQTDDTTTNVTATDVTATDTNPTTESAAMFKFTYPLPPVTIKRIRLDHVIEHPELFNTNNHHNDEGIDQVEDYNEVISKGETKNWVDKFHTIYYKITLNESHLSWMNKAAEIGMITGKFSHIYDDELDQICEKFEGQFPQGEWFVRSDRVSLKEGMHGKGPYSDFRSIIQSAVSSGQYHRVFEETDTECNLYLFPWKEIDSDKEFRIFVFNNRITAISVQHLYKINNYFNTLTDQEITEVVYEILNYFENHIKENMSYIRNYTIDLALVGSDDTPYFIEPNSFGKYYAAGSALYSWVHDEDTLHNSEEIEFRYCHDY